MRKRNQKSRRGFSLVELLIVIAIIMIIAGIAIPQYNKAMMSARETSATRTMQTIHAMQTQYYSQFGRYAASLAELGPPASGAAGPAAADLISKDLAEGKNNKEVANILNLSLYTVETHRSNIFQKLNLHSSAELILYAVRKGVIS